jgi:phosphatidylglycerol---prolipoprotein diacylglyceryl transferase
MLIHPQFDPIALQLGPLAIRWYGLMYLVGFILFIVLGHYRLKRPYIAAQGWTEKDLDDLLFFGVLGVIIGGRLGQVFFYDLSYFLKHPLEIIAVWQGGMSFHGGFLGVVCAMALWARKNKRHFFEVTDFIAPLCATGLAAGRIGNFINGELWGRITSADLPWAMIFPHVDTLPRHPSQLYQAGLEGLTLFALLWWYAQKPRARGALSAAFLCGYGTFRFIAEYFRTPDPGIFGYSDVISMGQWLSLPMIVIGGWLWFKCTRASTPV